MCFVWVTFAILPPVAAIGRAPLLVGGLVEKAVFAVGSDFLPLPLGLASTLAIASSAVTLLALDSRVGRLLLATMFANEG